MGVSEAETDRPRVAEDKVRAVDLVEDTLGFGEAEWRTFRDMLVRPRAALDAYLQFGPTGGGQYKRPVGFYIALCGVLTFYLFLLGGYKGIVEAQPADVLSPWLERSGKSRDEFINDVDGWISIISTPLLSAFYALLCAPLLIWWSGLDRRQGFRATFVLLNAWTAPVLFLGPLPFMAPFVEIGQVVLWIFLAIAFFRMGRGLWFESWLGGVAKMTTLYIVLVVSAFLGMIPVLYISLMGASFVG